MVHRPQFRVGFYQQSSLSAVAQIYHSHKPLRQNNDLRINSAQLLATISNFEDTLGSFTQSLFTCVLSVLYVGMALSLWSDDTHLLLRVENRPIKRKRSNMKLRFRISRAGNLRGAMQIMYKYSAMFSDNYNISLSPCVSV